MAVQCWVRKFAAGNARGQLESRRTYCSLVKIRQGTVVTASFDLNAGRARP